MATLLLVDDEPNILSALRRVLLARDDFGDAPDYQIHLFTSPQEALQASEHEHFDLVLSDYRMPEMSGVAFLTDFRYLQPDCIRIILSGMTDLQGLIAAINEVEIYRFLPKPWNDFELRSTIAGALRYQHLLLENQRMADELRTMREQSTRQEDELRRLEAEMPGITKVRWGPDGSVLL
ncbi:Response regulator receiver domain-containing protein [Andreprevotia lacus DSM 23236]|jgi:response regulator RpfG family c-di-GMP phosphodiesterase|uniref:Response regulator receiver domain-containing protein n=1 Tax=Andreprevotia lacus DSM 23236 TaxID=1121001 RepID=A0A1W1XFR1_9NEIS|nr:response regulator [Andreprevotia lacus]SMC22769.1 Response regulator receiver domain-containing protein [Andreprevotia lacus DSM 23236]